MSYGYVTQYVAKELSESDSSSDDRPSRQEESSEIPEMCQLNGLRLDIPSGKRRSVNRSGNSARTYYRKRMPGAPTMSYCYPPRYVAEELSDSEHLADDPPTQQVTSDITELYRRNGLRLDISSGKHQIVNQPWNSPGTYYQTHMPGYYEHHTRLRTTCACNLPPDPRYYKSVVQNQKEVLRSTTNVQTGPKAFSTSTVKKYPVTARTPKYYRRTPTQLCKRRSALCLPLTSQPDPAIFHRPHKVQPEIQLYRGQETDYAVNDYENDNVRKTTTTVKRTDAHRLDSEGDVNSRLNDLEHFLSKFDDDENKEENERIEISGVSELAKILKPKVPPSVKAQQEKKLKQRSTKINPNETVTTTENMTKLLPKFCHGAGEMLRIQTDVVQRNDEKHNDTNEGKEVPRMRAEIFSRQKHLFHLQQRPPLDDNSALELHKSKSYIVSLIDKALSKELGTVSGDTRKEIFNMNPKKAVDIINRHSSPKNKIHVENAQGSSSRKDEQCVCKSEGPLYLKQLKQLRWSHLRHIQREAKRLADLEKFLDSFSEADSQL